METVGHGCYKAVDDFVWYVGDVRMLKVGDTIKCHDADDMIRTMTELEKENITTDFMYEKDGVKGLWLVVERIRKK